MIECKAPALIEGMHIIETIAKSKEAVPFHILAANSSMSKASVIRLLKELSENGYIESGTRDGYSLGIKFLYILKDIADKLKPLEIISEKLQELSDSINSSVQFATYERTKPAITIIAKAECENSPVLVGQGTDIIAYSHRHALGKIIMAFAEDEEIEEILNKNRPCKKTPQTVMPGAQLDKILKQIKCDKVAFENQECISGIQRVAVPLFNAKGKIYGGLCASWFNHKFIKESSSKKAMLMMEMIRFITKIYFTGE
ncbi:MAG: Transcriptional regulator, IclR family [Candidatus Uhrbacteria bacterium GW2011_GWF2_39_13]|uniref:Transcriptional regulator, IclR family n=1 Tax=Candidatus Uhrbacteria bacterium GW2011_GWF2_39_13 TaxID=1618995 RepID=A0A0G0PZQ8_9BACT|nr:MAG: Transcriptional regulator, IclR family [Candidatus Uhrbacteria bacterium GW2011_GWF2_39_13]